MALSGVALAAVFGFSAGNSNTATTSPSDALAALKAAQAKGADTKGLAAEQKDPVVLSALAQFKKAIGSAKDVKAALKDPRVLAVLLPALGLSDQANYPGLVQKALLSDPNDTKGLLANLDSRFKTAATTLGLFTKGLAGLKDAATQKTLTDGYVQFQYQTGLDKGTGGMSDALYFIKNAAATKDVYSLLGNAVMRRVVTGALGIPQEIAIQPVDSQGRAITSRMKLTDLQDPKKVQLLAQRYVMAQAGSATSSAYSPILSLLA